MRLAEMEVRLLVTGLWALRISYLIDVLLDRAKNHEQSLLLKILNLYVYNVCRRISGQVDSSKKTKQNKKIHCCLNQLG